VYVAHVATVAVIELLAALSAPYPLAFVACALKVYEVPVDKPETTTGEDAPVFEKHPGVEITRYPVIPAGNAPVHPGAVNVTEAQLDVPAVAVPIVGAPGVAGHVLAPLACIC
jgi:hypothetical protein